VVTCANLIDPAGSTVVSNVVYFETAALAAELDAERAIR
jgi:hypothetical protein